MIKAVIFDMDGLMIDSERVTFECYQEILKPMNLTMDETFYKTLLGKPIKGIYERFYDTYGKDFPIDDVIKDVHALMAKRFETEGVPIKKGLLVLLNYLKEMVIRLLSLLLLIVIVSILFLHRLILHNILMTQFVVMK